MDPAKAIDRASRANHARDTGLKRPKLRNERCGLAHAAFSLLTTLCAAVALPALAAEPLDAKGWAAGEHGVVILQVNWGRQWGCGGFENAQLVRLRFDQLSPPTGQTPDSLELETPSMVRVDDRFEAYAFLLRPGRYALAGFELKVAKSMSEVLRREVGPADLVHDGEALGGRFRIDAGEIVYIGGFGLDCAADPIPWRYYIDDSARFEASVAGFRNRFPFTQDRPVRYRLFETDRFGEAPEFPSGQSPITEIAPAAQTRPSP